MQMAAPAEMQTLATTGTVAPPTETPTLEDLEHLEAKLDSQLRRWDKPTVAQVTPALLFHPSCQTPHRALSQHRCAMCQRAWFCHANLGFKVGSM